MDDALDRGHSGFSLIETMIVVAVMAVLAVGATLSLGPRADGATDAARLSDLHAALRAEAILERAPRGLLLSPDGFAVLRPDDGDGWVTGTAQSFAGQLAQVLPGYGAERDGAAGLRAVWLPDGRGSAFAVRLEGGGGTWDCRTDGWEPMTCTARD